MRWGRFAAVALTGSVSLSCAGHTITDNPRADAAADAPLETAGACGGVTCGAHETCCDEPGCAPYCTPGICLPCSDGSLLDTGSADADDAGVCFESLDASAVSPADCPAGSVYMVQVGGVAGGGPSWCAPIPPECNGTPTCACLGACGCAPHDSCDDTLSSDTIYCDNHVR